MLSASSRSSLAVAKRAPAGWVAVEATSRPRQFGYETPQLRLERRLHAGSPYRSNDLVSAGPEPPLSCDLRLNHAASRTPTFTNGSKARRGLVFAWRCKFASGVKARPLERVLVDVSPSGRICYTTLLPALTDEAKVTRWPSTFS